MLRKKRDFIRFQLIMTLPGSDDYINLVLSKWLRSYGMVSRRLGIPDCGWQELWTREKYCNTSSALHQTVATLLIYLKDALLLDQNQTVAVSIWLIMSYIHGYDDISLSREQFSDTLQNSCVSHGPLTRYVKLQVAHAPGMPGTFSPAADFKENC